ncbi:hypothetical protein [Heyndrickxia shackletonii]|uniref:hypothetical protein n=1 Tax=Heyndrickxia shackletonii TaxID=157838 RepID=UPI0006EBF6F9|nr:hypothetical protein [Heyndrickxia shackletonii]
MEFVPQKELSITGEKVLPNKVTAHDLIPDSRLRLKGNNGEWFRYDVNNVFGDIYEKVANKALTQLSKAEEYWGIMT